MRCIWQDFCDVGSSYLIPFYVAVVIRASSQVDLASCVDRPSILQFFG